MTYSKQNKLDIPISKIVFGCCNPILISGSDGSEALLDRAITEGFNVFDTAKVYGKSEELLGEWLSNTGNRKNVTLITKGCHPDNGSRLNVEALKEDIDSSLKRLKTDYIDIYMLHRDDPEADLEPILVTLNYYIRQGIIKRIGVSNWTHQRIEKINHLAESMGLIGFTVSSPQFSLARQIRDPWGDGCVSISGDFDAYKWYRYHKEILVLPYSCLAHGFLSGKISSRRVLRGFKQLDHYAKKGFWCWENISRLKRAEALSKKINCTVSQVALSWCISQEFSAFPIVTVSSVERMREDIGALKIKLSEEDIEKLY